MKNGNNNVNRRVEKIVGNLEKLDELVPRYGDEKTEMDNDEKIVKLESEYAEATVLNFDVIKE